MSELPPTKTSSVVTKILYYITVGALPFKSCTYDTR